MRPTLEPGKLYQVKNAKGWIIAEYVKEVQAHSYNYHNIYLDTMTTSKEKTRHVPLSHTWKKVRAKDGEAFYSFTLADRGMEVRPVTMEAITEIARLKREILEAEATLTAKKKELREFCE